MSAMAGDRRVGLITGAARGQGREIARVLANDGVDLVLCDAVRDFDGVPYPLATSDDLEETAEMVRAAGSRCAVVEANVAEPGDVAAAVGAGVEALGPIGLVVSNAGVMSPSPVASMSDAAWLTTVEVNLSGFFHVLRATVPSMVEHGGGAVVAVASTFGRQGAAGMANYVASQWALIGLAKCIAAEVGPAGIRVNLVCPSYVDTPMLDGEHFDRWARPDLAAPTRAEVDEALARQHLLGAARVSPLDVANAVRFLLSDEARSITGYRARRLGGGEHPICRLSYRGSTASSRSRWSRARRADRAARMRARWRPPGRGW